MKRYDAWSEPEDAQRGYTTGSYRQELLEKTLGQYVTFDDHERAMSEITAERDRLAAEVDAANATLNRLREVGIDPSYHGNPADWASEDKLDALIQFQAILYPPETPSIRDTAAAHGFDTMPDDLAQRSVDGETNYVRLNPESEA